MKPSLTYDMRAFSPPHRFIFRRFCLITLMVLYWTSPVSHELFTSDAGIQPSHISEEGGEWEGQGMPPPQFLPSPDGDADLVADSFAFRDKRDLDGDGIEEDIRWLPLVDAGNRDYRLPSRSELLWFSPENGDLIEGAPDSIRFEHLLIQVSGDSCTIPAEGCAPSLWFIDIDTRDSHREFVVDSYGPSDVLTLHLYYFRNGRIRSMGEFPAFEAPGRGRILVSAHGDIFPGWNRTDFYDLSETHALRLVDQELYAMNLPVTLKFDLRLFAGRNARKPTILLRRGAQTSITRTDDKKWLEVKASDGRCGWVMVDDGYVPTDEDEYSAEENKYAAEVERGALSGSASQYTFGLHILDLP